MLEIKKISTPIEDMKEEIRVFKKNEQSIYDMLALYKCIQDIQETNSSVDNIICMTLLEKVIDNFEDPEVEILYKGQNIQSIFDHIDDLSYSIFNKYSVPECLGLRDEFNTSYKYNAAFYNLYNKNLREPINLIHLLMKDLSTSSLVNEFFASNIPFDVRLEMFGDMLDYEGINFLKILTSKSPIGRTKDEVINEKRKELIDAFQAGNCMSYNIEKLFYKLFGSNREQIVYLQDNPFDFNQIYMEIPADISTRIPKISAVALMEYGTNDIRNVKKMYESESYMKVPKDIRNNNDLYILEYEKSGLTPLIELVTFSHFEVTEEKIRVITKKYLEYEKASNLQIESDRKAMQRAIISKAKNKEEYKILSKYADMFMQESDYKSICEKEQKEKEELRVARQSLYTRLYNMNDSLQEQVPGKTYIKDLCFKK